MRTYDESDLVGRLSQLDRQAKTAFAAACAERLLPMFERYARLAGEPELGPCLAQIVSSAWEAAAGSAPTDMADLQANAEAMVPSDEDGWTREMGYGQNAAAAAAYAIRTWLTDDPQEAAWAARQGYELADYSVLQGDPDLDLNAADAESRVHASDLVQQALSAIANALVVVEGGPSGWQDLRGDAEADGRRLADLAP